jgi:hypothetical protein
VKLQLFEVTLCHRKVALSFVHNSLISQPLCQRGRPFFNSQVRFAGYSLHILASGPSGRCCELVAVMRVSYMQRRFGLQ